MELVPNITFQFLYPLNEREQRIGLDLFQLPT